MNRAKAKVTIFRVAVSLAIVPPLTLAGVLVGCRSGVGNVRPHFGIHGADVSIGPFIVGVPVSEVLPEASGGNGDLTYSLTPVPEGLQFHGDTRMLTGIPEPNTAGSHEVTYAVKDGDGDAVTVTFTIAVEGPSPPVPVVAIEAERSRVTEGTAARFTVRAKPAPVTELLVNVSWSETGSMLAASPPSTVTISTSGSATLTAGTVEDTTAEPDSRVTAVLSGGAGYTVGSPGSAAVLVQDDTPPPPPPPAPVVAMEAERSAVTEGTTVRFTVRATPAPAMELVVNVSWSETGSMLAASPPSTVRIATSGSGALTADTVEDTTAELDSRVTATLNGGTGYRVGSPRSGAVQVEDDDRALLPRVSLDSVTPTTIQEGERVTMILSIEPASTVRIRGTVRAIDSWIDGTSGKGYGFGVGSTTTTARYSVPDDGVTTTDRTITFQLNRSHQPTVYSTDMSRVFTVTVTE